VAGIDAPDPDLTAILPLGALVDDAGHLVLGGVDVAALAARFGTPLYVYDEETIRAACRAYTNAFIHRYPSNHNHVHYAAKAYLAPWLCRVLREEGLGLDVVSGGELHVALAGGVPASAIRLHGNNKPPGELREALAVGVGRIVVDNADELRLLDEVATASGRRAAILLRLSPGVEAHTHQYLQTGLLDSKFGFPIASPDGDVSRGDALRAVREVLSLHRLDLRGYHAHVGTSLFEPEPIAESVRRLLAFAHLARRQTGYWPAELSPGGGLGIAYERDERPPSVTALAEAIAGALSDANPPPAVSVEPGRSIVGRAGVALYTVGARKTIEGVRRYVSVDGGMADNIRPALYGARYTALAATRMREPAMHTITVAGRYCESGDILVRDALLPALMPDDLLAIPAAGAYCLPMSSAYNGALRPAVVVVRDGAARLVQRRGTYDDLLAYDLD